MCSGITTRFASAHSFSPFNCFPDDMIILSTLLGFFVLGLKQASLQFMFGDFKNWSCTCISALFIFERSESLSYRRPPFITPVTMAAKAMFCLTWCMASGTCTSVIRSKFEVISFFECILIDWYNVIKSIRFTSCYVANLGPFWKTLWTSCNAWLRCRKRFERENIFVVVTHEKITNAHTHITNTHTNSNTQTNQPTTAH